jgi:hypothetical protein
VQFDYWYCMTLGWNTLQGPQQGTIANIVTVNSRDPHARFVAATEDAKVQLRVGDDQLPTVIFYCNERMN